MMEGLFTDRPTGVHPTEQTDESWSDQANQNGYWTSYERGPLKIHPRFYELNSLDKIIEDVEEYGKCFDRILEVNRNFDQTCHRIVLDIDNFVESYHDSIYAVVLSDVNSIQVLCKDGPSEREYENPMREETEVLTAISRGVIAAKVIRDAQYECEREFAESERRRLAGPYIPRDSDRVEYPSMVNSMTAAILSNAGATIGMPMLGSNNWE